MRTLFDGEDIETEEDAPTGDELSAGEIRAVLEGMAGGVLLQVGLLYPHEARSGIGHCAATLGGIPYESRGGRGCLRGSAARGADHRLFRHQFHLPLTREQAKAAKRYADAQVGRPYVWGGVPAGGRGGDCSGYVSGILCAARGLRPRRLFSTGYWVDRYRDLGFRPGLGGPVDRPYPGYVIRRGSTRRGHVNWIKSRLHLAGAAPSRLDGRFDGPMEQHVRDFQKARGLQVDGEVGRQTWRALNLVA